MLCKMVLIFHFMNEALITSKATCMEQHFLVVLFITLYMMVLIFESLDEILKRDHSLKAIEQCVPVVLWVFSHTYLLPLPKQDFQSQ